MTRADSSESAGPSAKPSTISVPSRVSQSSRQAGDDGQVFKALADPTRRHLLDALFAQDGRSLTELESELEMSRFGVMKHLRLLEQAGLVVTRRPEGKKLHFLNPVPIRLIHDRWIDKYTEQMAAALSDLKHRLETTMEKIYEIYIRTTPEKLWEAITDPEIRSKYNFGARLETDWQVGSPYQMTAPKAGGPLAEGEILEADPPRRLVHTMIAPVERRRQERRHVEGHLADRAGRGLLLPHRDPRRAPRGGQPSALRRLADDPFGTEDLARDRRTAHDAGIAPVRD